MNQIHSQSPRQCGKTWRDAVTVIAFTGKAGAGKDSAAAVLHNHCKFETVAFGDSLRREIAEAWHIDERMLTHRPTKELALPALAVGMCCEPTFIRWCFDAGECIRAPRSPRWAMQHWADFQRRYSPAHYAAPVVRWISRQAGAGFRRFAITDLRDPVELAALDALGLPLCVVRVHSRDASVLREDTMRHSSERHRLPAHFDIHNDGSLEALRDSVLALPPVVALMGATAGGAA